MRYLVVCVLFLLAPIHAAFGQAMAEFTNIEDGFRIAQRVERECPGQLSRRIEVVDAGQKASDETQVLSGQVRSERQTGERVVRRGQVGLRLHRDGIGRVDGSVGHQTRRKSADRSARPDSKAA